MNITVDEAKHAQDIPGQLPYVGILETQTRVADIDAARLHRIFATNVFGAFVPMKRGGTAKEVAHAIVWLLSDESSFTTGSLIDAAGGR